MVRPSFATLTPGAVLIPAGQMMIGMGTCCLIETGQGIDVVREGAVRVFRECTALHSLKLAQGYQAIPWPLASQRCRNPL